MDPRNFTYMFYGFSAAWVIIVLYALTLLGRERKMKDEIARLKNMLEEKERK
jgi:CcmD family protein